MPSDELTDDDLREMEARFHRVTMGARPRAEALRLVAALRHSREAEAKARGECERLRAALGSVADEFERTIAHADWVAAGRKGMHVPFHGDFAAAVQLPSVVSRMRWWLREFKRALGGAKLAGAAEE